MKSAQQGHLYGNTKVNT